MKKIIIAISLISISTGYVFSEIPAFMIEANAGYSIGINLNNATQIDMRLYYPFENFGLLLEGGIIIAEDNNYAHALLAPMYMIVNTSKWRVPVAVGIDLIMGKKNLIYGIGAITAVHYAFAESFYVGFYDHPDGLDIPATRALDRRDCSGHSQH